MNHSINVSHLGNTPEELKQAILDKLHFVRCRTPELATRNDWYVAVSSAMRERMIESWIHGIRKLRHPDTKIVGYLSAEFLMGPQLGNALINLGLYDEMKRAVEMLGLDLNHILYQEEEPGLGNGGLGRLAACYLDSMSTLRVPAIGYGIRYEFGIFDQLIENGEQKEVADMWLRYGNPWEVPQPEIAYTIKFGGQTESYRDEEDSYRVRWNPEYEVRGVAYDTPVPGYKVNAVNILRLWKSEAMESFDFNEFNRGNYEAAVNEKTRAETLSKVLYPNDEPEAGRKLRLSQQYFFVSCSLQDAIRLQKVRGLPLSSLHENFVFQLNDTHPSIAIAEMMRLLIDEHLMEWEEAWKITSSMFNYTNHTLLPEALEKWPMYLFHAVLPRHLEIIFEINQRFLDQVKEKFPEEVPLLAALSIIDEQGGKAVRMANLASVGSKHINGVSKLHTELLKKEVLRDFHHISPEKFINITNGVSPRRWIRQYNPELSALLTEHLGEHWITHLETDLIKLEKLADDAAFQKRWHQIRQHNKKALVDQLIVTTGVLIDPATLFDVQVKRIHEYKRQHLNILHIITQYNRIRKDPKAYVAPRTFVFGGKAAPAYFQAKLIIRLVYGVAEVINSDFDVAGRLKIVFYPDFNVKNAEWIYRAADLSEQISTAGKEASGTGNMKFSLNGALTIGTLDGANIEIRESVGADNFFLFGLTAQEVAGLKAAGYRPQEYYDANEELKEAIDAIRSGTFSKGDGSVFEPLTDTLLHDDPFMLLADYASYIKCQEEVSKAWLDQAKWTKMSILNVARMGYFSSDRAVEEYCAEIWNVKAHRNNGK